jgi:hypothetical protein
MFDWIILRFLGRCWDDSAEGTFGFGINTEMRLSWY